MTIHTFPFQTLKVGETFQISLLGDFSDPAKYKVKYIGGIDKKSLICTVPTLNDKTMFIKEFTGFSVQFFSGKNVYRFNTVVDAVFNRPYPHLHLMFPKELVVNRVRKNQRISVSKIASMRNVTKGERFNSMQSGRMVDLSLCGAMLESFKQGLQEGDSVECSFKVSLDEQDVMLVLKSFVRSIKNAQNPEGKIVYRYGLQFVELPFQENMVLQNYIFKEMSKDYVEAV